MQINLLSKEMLFKFFEAPADSGKVLYEDNKSWFMFDCHLLWIVHKNVFQIWSWSDFLEWVTRSGHSNH